MHKITKKISRSVDLKTLSSGPWKVKKKQTLCKAGDAIREIPF